MGGRAADTDPPMSFKSPQAMMQHPPADTVVGFWLM
jgi:hypothetical protein